MFFNNITPYKTLFGKLYHLKIWNSIIIKKLYKIIWKFNKLRRDLICRKRKRRNNLNKKKDTHKIHRDFVGAVC